MKTPVGLLLLSVLLSACATAPPRPAHEVLLQDALFAPVASRPEPQQMLALSPAMREFLDRSGLTRSDERASLAWLIGALANFGPLSLSYDSSQTRSAAEAFDGRAGNCLSLTMMVGAFAKALDIPFRFQSVYIADTWSRSGDLNLASGHVNIALGNSPITGSRLPGSVPNATVVDFLPAEELRDQRTRGLREETVLAMYMNNRAVEWMARAQLDEAYVWVRGAILQDPSFVSSYNTLGVIYSRHHNLPEAERSLRYALSLEPENSSAMSNLVPVLADQGKAGESKQLAARLAQIDPTPPFLFFDQGVAAMKRGDYAAAKKLFTREVRRAAYNHEFHFWLALADLGLGEPEKARKHLAIALENSTSPREHALYAAKLDWLDQRLRQADANPG